jgi:hypothetical protein
MKLRETLSKQWQGLTDYLASEDSSILTQLLADGARRLLMNAHRTAVRIADTYTDRQLTLLTLTAALLNGLILTRIF